MRQFIILIILAITICSCGGQLSDEQRKAMQEEQQRREIKKVTDQQIMQAALETGRNIREALSASGSMDSLEQAYDARIRFFTDTSGQDPIESELWSAYQASLEQGETPEDNVQRDYPDYLYYTYWQSSDSLPGMISVRMSRKEIILNF
jgi:hypothetical protein